MVSFADLNCIYKKLKTQLFLMIGRCTLKEVFNSSETTQTVNITCLKDESLTKVQHIQDYGFEHYPPVENSTEGIVIFINGNRDQGSVLKLGNREYKPNDLTEGQVCLYSKDSSDGNTNRITISPDNIISIETFDGNVITIDSNGVVIEDSNGNKVTMNSTGIKIEDINANTVEMNSTGIILEGGTEAFLKGTTFDTWLTTTLLTIFNTHTHSGVVAGPASTGTPNAALTGPINYLSTKIKGL